MVDTWRLDNRPMRITKSITVASDIDQTPRVQQIEGIFDLQHSNISHQSWTVEMPLDDQPWNIGLIVGPSGSGKSTIARQIWPEEIAAYENQNWPDNQSIVDGFPEDTPVKEIIHLLSSVGFSSPPAWLRPYRVLSTGQRFRASVARALAGNAAFTVIDEFTSVVDRTVAQIGSAAIAKTVRALGKQFVAISCHEDIIDWLNPDWIYRPEAEHFEWRLLRRRPLIELEIQRVHRSTWKIFRHHHYLDNNIASGAVCYLATWNDRPVAFTSWLQSLTSKNAKREHRTVTLPDFQGVGIGHAISTCIASMWKALGNRATSTTTHPAFAASRKKDPRWICTRNPSLAHTDSRKQKRYKHAGQRLTAGFEYVGPPMDQVEALKLRA